MKKIYVPGIAFIFFVFMVSSMVSCKKSSFLTATTTTNLTESTIFADSANTVGFLANIYANAGFSESPTRFVFDPLGKNIPCGGLDAACDEAEVSHTFATTAYAFAIGAVNPLVVTDDAYKICYTNIRAVNQLFKNISKTPLLPQVREQMKAEARFLRAWYYADLLKHYGGIPLIGDSVYTYTEAIGQKRSSYEQCVNYITSECDAVVASGTLPAAQQSLAYGRASTGACLALKSRVLLYAASPLFNVAGNEFVCYQDVSSGAVLNRWKKAMDAAVAVESLGAYGLSTDTKTIAGYGTVGAFQNLFTMRVNKEYIFQLMQPSSNTILENLFQPPSRTGSNGAFPYQEMVDAFPMKNGLPITDASSGYDPNNPYANRDPRLEATILHDQSLLGNRTSNGQINGYSPINIFIGNYNGIATGQDAIYQGTPTGYYRNKMLDPNAIAQGFFNTSQRCFPLIRYAEVLLNFAEAANEYNGGPTTDVYDALKRIRARAGLTTADAPPGLSQDQMRAFIQNERRIELAYEGHRFFDVRRWKIAEFTENKQMTGMEVDRNGTTASGTVTYKVIKAIKHNFNIPMYFWPFPQLEVSKGLVQNPGY